jgi:hypothetical protein
MREQSKSMEALPLSLVSVLDKEQRFIVPVYQRTYEWTVDKQIAQFFAQVEAKATARLAGDTKQLPHYMGALLLMPRSGPSLGRLSVYDVVDGQQRLTTFQISLAALRDLALALEQDGLADQLASYILNRNRSHMQNERDERYRLHVTGYDRALFRNLVDLRRDELRNTYPDHFFRNGNIRGASVPKPLRAYWYLRDEAETFTRNGAPEDVVERLTALATALLSDIRVIAITLGTEDDAQVIFETLNSGGEPLAAMDLVRNDVFHRAARQGANVEELLEQRWSRFETPFWKESISQGRISKPRIDFFLAHTMAAETGKEILLSELYARYKSFAAERGFANVDHELQALLRHAPTYEMLTNPTGGTALARLARRLEAFDVSTAFPLVFTIAASPVPEPEKAQLYDLIASYVIRRALTEGLSAKNYNNTFIRIAAALKSNGVSTAAFAAAFADSDGPTVRFPRDAEFIAAIKSHRQYGRLVTPRIKWVLEELEFASRTDFDETAGLKDDLTVEHLLPDRWTTHWPLPGGMNVPPDLRTGLTEDQIRMADAREALKHCLGNLTLLTAPANIEAQHYAFHVKCERLRTSLLRMNQDIAAEPTWDDAAIARRGERLAALAIRLWPDLPERT